MAEWIRVAAVSDCEPDTCLHATAANGQKLVIARWDGEYYALEDKCSHQDFPLSEGEVEDGEIECIFHGARFDLESGKATQMPAIKPVKTFPVEVRGDEIYVAVG